MKKATGVTSTRWFSLRGLVSLIDFLLFLPELQFRLPLFITDFSEPCQAAYVLAPNPRFPHLRLGQKSSTKEREVFQMSNGP